MEALPVHGLAYGKLATPRATGAFVTLVIFVILTASSVAVLFYSRLKYRGKLLLFDWMVLLALLVYYGFCIAAFLSDSYLAFFIGGIGWHIWELGSAELTRGLQLTLSFQVLYAFSLGLLKVSLCLLLAHIFPSRKFRLFAYATAGLSVAWAIMTILIGFLLCRPIGYNWDRSIPGGRCGNQNAAYSSVGVVDILVDVIICILPLPKVWNLKTRTATKISLTMLFLLGLLTIAMTAVRLYVTLTLDFENFSYSSTNIYIWTTAEWGVAIMVACGPGTKPLLESLKPNFFNSLITGYRSKAKSGRSSKSRSQTNDKVFRNGSLYDDSLPLALENDRGSDVRKKTTNVDYDADENIELQSRNVNYTTAEYTPNFKAGNTKSTRNAERDEFLVHQINVATEVTVHDEPIKR